MQTIVMLLATAAALGAVILGVRAYRDHERALLVGSVFGGLGCAWVAVLLLVAP